MSRYSVTDTTSHTGGWIMDTARRNPEALLLLAAGCVLLMRSGGSSSSHAYSSQQRPGDHLSRSGSNSFTQAAESASDYASEMKDRVSNTAGSYAAGIKDRLSDTAETVSEFAADARRNVDVWTREIEEGGLDAIIVTASGCGTTIKDYGYMLRLDEAYRDKAAKVSALAKDVTEYLATLDMPEPAAASGLTVAYHSACSMQHGQKIIRQPKDLLKAAGFTVKDPAEGHLCCGSAGTYNIRQSEIATQLRDRKVRNIEATKADLIATGNIGCITQIASGSKLPIVHTVELLDWAYGGPKPAELQ